MLDIAVAYNRYRFLGNEFLTWIWFCIENEPEVFHTADKESIELSIGNRMVLENHLANGTETITIKGDAAGLEEALLALSKGATITEVNLNFKKGPIQWQFTLIGESLAYSNLRLPEINSTESGDEIELEGVILEKLYLYETLFEFIDMLYRIFLRRRLSPQWQKKTLSTMRKWVLLKI
jgi:hypothetical protein